VKNNKTNTKQRFALWRTVVFLALILGLFSCKKGRLIGPEIQPEGYLDSLILVDTFTVHAYTFEPEPQRSTRYSNYIGRMHNDVFGTSQATVFMNFNLESENIYLELPPSSYTVDSLVFVMWPLTAIGDPSEPQTFEVYAVDEFMDVDSVYLSNRSFRTDDAPLARKTLAYKDIDSVASLLTNPDFSGIKFHLGTDIGEFLLYGIGNGYTTSAGFRSYFPGLALRVSENDANLTGALYNVAVSGVQTGMTLYYHYTDPEDDSTIINTQLNYEVLTSNTRHNYFEHDRSGSLLESYLSRSDHQHDLLFVQGMSGTKVRIDVPSLSHFAQTTDAAISKATLTFTTADEQPEGLDFSRQLYLLDYEKVPTTGDTIETITLDYAHSAVRYGGSYNATEGQYTFEVTREVQKIIEAAQKGEDVNHGFSLNAQIPVINGNVRAQNVLKGSSDVLLRVYYTDISE
jgi:hypothetical protein